MKDNGSESDRRSLPLLGLLPNLVTVLGLCAGLTSIRFMLDGDYRFAAGLIVLAAIIDGLDGLLARRLKATSDFGAELDSLADFLSFGVAPALLVFLALLSEAPGIGWLSVLVFAVCCCLRLARFNVSKGLEMAGERHPKAQFVGVPAPAGALLALLPMFMLFDGNLDASAVPILTAAWLALVGAMMFSQLPTISPKSVLIPRDKIVWVLIATTILIGLLLTRFWLALILFDLAYIVLLARSLVVARHSRV
jgi:CDP-diacylglycerol--serine O-phosphatidyltransferase